MVRGDRRGCIRLRDAIIGIEDDDDTIFSITSDTEVFHCKGMLNYSIIEFNMYFMLLFKQRQQQKDFNHFLVIIIDQNSYIFY